MTGGCAQALRRASEPITPAKRRKKPSIRPTRDPSASIAMTLSEQNQVMTCDA